MLFVLLAFAAGVGVGAFLLNNQKSRGPQEVSAIPPPKPPLTDVGGCPTAQQMSAKEVDVAKKLGKSAAQPPTDAPTARQMSPKEIARAQEHARLFARSPEPPTAAQMTPSEIERAAGDHAVILLPLVSCPPE
ncbi:hypothetical protein M3Y99_00834500 [Aphelenchoides fujianensis]|nr:hypothetical protein M3Y99_00834500 [Aphelenchoides fujianensis]